MGTLVVFSLLRFIFHVILPNVFLSSSNVAASTSLILLLYLFFQLLYTLLYFLHLAMLQTTILRHPQPFHRKCFHHELKTCFVIPFITILTIALLRHLSNRGKLDKGNEKTIALLMTKPLLTSCPTLFKTYSEKETQNNLLF